MTLQNGKVEANQSLQLELVEPPPKINRVQQVKKIALFFEIATADLERAVGWPVTIPSSDRNGTESSRLGNGRATKLTRCSKRFFHFGEDQSLKVRGGFRWEEMK